MKKNICLTILSFTMVGQLNAQYLMYNKDSVMTPSNNLSSNNIDYNTGSFQSPVITSNSSNEIRWTECPTGFTYNGNNSYPSEIRSVVSYYMNNQYNGTSYSGWYDLDSSCNKIEEQTISCPVGYTGNEYQRRNVSTRDGKSFDYSAWNTYQSNCVYVPPLKAGYLDDVIISANSGVQAFQYTCPVKDCISVYYYSYKGISKKVGGTAAALTIHPQSGQLACIAAGSGTSGSGESNSAPDQNTYILPPNTSFDHGSFYCTISNNGKSAELYGNCNGTTGGDSSMCVGETLKANIVNINGCTATIETIDPSKIAKQHQYSLC